MTQHRTEILDWIAQGRLRPDAWSAALRIAGITPDTRSWRIFLDQLMLWLGTISCASAVIFFFAYNWQEMGRFAKFALVELLIVGSLVMCWQLDVERLSGKAVLLLATLLVGALLALVGQTYQTGADTYELFTAWALAVLVWVVVGRLGALWLVWLGLVNVAVVLYFQTFGGFFGMLFNTEKQMWALFIINTMALVIWELAARSGAAWLRERWSVRILATASGGLATTLMMWTILDSRYGSSAVVAAAYFAWLAAAYFYYRHRVLDVFVLAGGMLSAVIITATFLGKHILRHNDAGGFLLIGLVIIAMSALGGFWLKSIATEERT